MKANEVFDILKKIEMEFFGECSVECSIVTEKDLYEGYLLHCIDDCLAYAGNILFNFKYIDRISYSKVFLHYGKSLFAIRFELTDEILFCVEYTEDMDNEMYLTNKNNEFFIETFDEIEQYLLVYQNKQRTRDRIELQLEQIVYEDSVSKENENFFIDEAYDFLKSDGIGKDSYGAVLFHLGVLSLNNQKEDLIDQKDIFTRIIKENKFEEFIDYCHNCGWSEYNIFCDTMSDVLNLDAKILKIKKEILDAEEGE